LFNVTIGKWLGNAWGSGARTHLFDGTFLGERYWPDDPEVNTFTVVLRMIDVLIVVVIYAKIVAKTFDPPDRTRSLARRYSRRQIWHFWLEKMASLESYF
jgi:hypothetical protein